MLRPLLPSRKAFTLIELLVVVAIIGIIAAILFPVFGRARENARRTTCQSNLKQFGTAAMMYLQDNDERYPMGIMPLDEDAGQYRTALDSLMPYVKNEQIATCPNDTGDIDIDFSFLGSRPFSYGGNDWIFRSPMLGNPLDPSNLPEPPLTLPQIDKESEIPLIYEAANHDAIEPTSAYNPQAFRAFIQVEKRHFSGANCLFVDGHVKWYRDRPPSVDPASDYPLNYWNVNPELIQ